MELDKMAILYAEKIREVINKSLDIDIKHLNYPIFLAHVDKVESKSGEVSEWLEERLKVVLEQWKEWQNKAELLKIDNITTKLDKEEEVKNRQKTLFSKFKGKTPEIKKVELKKLKEGKSETKISKSLEELLK